MSLIQTAVVVAAEAERAHTELPMPPVLFGVITLLVFALMALVAWSYRDVANRHSQVSGKLGGDGSGHSAAHGG